jgi:CRISPR-associated exonuclease Cas4
MTPITGLHIAYWAVCPRKLWLWAHGIRQDDLRVPEGRGAEKIARGRNTEQDSYRRRSARREGLMVEIPGFRVKVDYYDPSSGTLHETKLSSALEEAHVWQVKLYLMVLNAAGMPAGHAVLEYPQSRERHEIHYTSQTALEIEEAVTDIQAILSSETCPGLLHAQRCKSCAFHDFCYAGETDG